MKLKPLYILFILSALIQGCSNNIERETINLTGNSEVIPLYLKNLTMHEVQGEVMQIIPGEDRPEPRIIIGYKAKVDNLQCVDFSDGSRNCDWPSEKGRGTGECVNREDPESCRNKALREAYEEAHHNIGWDPNRVYDCRRFGYSSSAIRVIGVTE